MIPHVERFKHYLISTKADGRPLELRRLGDELVFLAFDSHIQRLVELHILRSVSSLDAAQKRSTLERAVQAAEIRGPGFVRILTVGEDDGLVYFTSSLNDGEFIDDYIARRGPLPPATTFCLVLQLLDDLAQLRSYHRLISGISLEQPLVTTLEDTFLQLRVFDFGLSRKEQRGADDLRGLTAQICELIFLLLTGKRYAGENTDRYPALTCLPSSLRSTLRHALADRANAPPHLDKLRDDVREAFGALVSGLKDRNTRKHLVVTSENFLPRSQLQELLLENVPLDELMRGRFVPDASASAIRYPFTIPATQAKTGQPVTVHLLPPSRIVPKDQYEAVPLQTWRFEPRKHPNILRSLSLWENPDWTFLTEERENGFPLSRLIAERMALNPGEVLVLLKHVRAGIDQAVECGVDRLDLHPSNILLLVGKGGPMQAREFERLMQKRLDAWPSLGLKLRPHMTMRSLYEPLLLDVPDDQAEHDSHFHAKDFRNRSFVALAVYLLTGERHIGRSCEFPETVPLPLAEFLRSALDQAKRFGKTPAPHDVLAAFEKSLVAGTEAASVTLGQPRLPASQPRVPAEPIRIPAASVEELESAGSVSDFEEDADSAAALQKVRTLPKNTRRTGIVAAAGSVPQKHRLGRMLLWGTVTVILGILLISILAGNPADQEPVVPGPAAATAVTTDGNPAAESAGAPSAAKPGAARRMFIMIRRAIIPTREEVEAYRRKQAASQREQKSPADQGGPSQVLADRSANR